MTILLRVSRDNIPYTRGRRRGRENTLGRNPAQNSYPVRGNNETRRDVFEIVRFCPCLTRFDPYTKNARFPG